ncbi:hypothetical protein Tco_0454615 [Tanacetum coccineum]
MGFNQYSQQQQQNQSTGFQPPSDHQSFNLIDETEDENEEDPIPTPTPKKSNRDARLKAKAKKTKDTESQVEIKKRARNVWTQNEELLLVKSKHKWTNPESTNARRYRFRVTDKEPEHFGDDALPRPPGLQRIAKSQRSGSNSTASSGSNPLMYQEFMKEQYELDCKAKMEVIVQESEERRMLIHSQRIVEDMKVLQIDTRRMDPADAVIINAQKARIRAAFPPTN